MWCSRTLRDHPCSIAWAAYQSLVASVPTLLVRTITWPPRQLGSKLLPNWCGEHPRGRAAVPQVAFGEAALAGKRRGRSFTKLVDDPILGETTVLLVRACTPPYY